MCPHLLESPEFLLFMAASSSDFAAEIKSLNSLKEKTSVHYLEQLEEYFFVQGTFKDDKMYCALKEISETQ